MAKTKVKVKGLDSSIGIGARRAIAYTVLILISILCLFWFYVLFINATRSNSDLTRGFRALPSTNAIANWTNMLNSSLPVVRGMFNSLVVAGCSAVVSTYFSTMTAYAIHAYDFKLRKFMFTFIVKDDDPFAMTDHIGSHSHAAILVKYKGIQQVPGNF